jgi:uncharacterized protein (TIGR00251 family)
MAELPVRVQPKARANEIVGFRAGRLLVRVTSAPEDGKANKAVCRLLAKRLGVPVSRLEVIRGVTSRDKVIRIEGISEEQLAGFRESHAK